MCDRGFHVQLSSFLDVRELTRSACAVGPYLLPHLSHAGLTSGMAIQRHGGEDYAIPHVSAVLLFC
jgi:hypothetical protein